MLIISECLAKLAVRSKAFIKTHSQTSAEWMCAWSIYTRPAWKKRHPHWSFMYFGTQFLLRGWGTWYHFQFSKWKNEWKKNVLSHTKPEINFNQLAAPRHCADRATRLKTIHLVGYEPKPLHLPHESLPITIRYCHIRRLIHLQISQSAWIKHSQLALESSLSAWQWVFG